MRLRVLNVDVTTTALATAAAAEAVTPELIVLLVLFAITDEVAIAASLLQRSRQFS